MKAQNPPRAGGFFLTAVFLLLPLALSSYSSCAPNDGQTMLGSSSSSSSDSTELDATVESAVGAANSALNDVEKVSSYAFSAPSRGSLIESAYAAGCGTSRFSPAIGTANCAGTENDRTVTASFAGCTAGPGNEVTLTGAVTLAFDSAATCNTWISGSAFPGSGSVTRTMSSFARQNASGIKVTTDSNTHVNYLSESVGGGVVTTFGVSNRTIQISGLHRARTLADGSAGFDHSVRTTEALLVSGTKAGGTRKIASGAVRVDHNKLNYSATTSFSNVTWSSTCCYPTGGTLTLLLSGSLSGAATANFNTGTCGRVSVIDVKGKASEAQLFSCE